MKVISAEVKRKLNHNSPGMWDAKLGDLVEALQKQVNALERRIVELESAEPGNGGGGSAGSGSSTWDTA